MNELKFGDTTFHIQKMLPMEAKTVFMKHVRPLLKGALSAEVSEGSNQGWKLFLAAFTDAPQEHYDMLVKCLYKHITWQRKGDTFSLLGDEEDAFKDMSMANIIELDIRAFRVNFQDSLLEIASKLRSLPQDFQLPGQGT